MTGKYFIGETSMLDVTNGCLWQEGTKLHLPPKVFAVLCYLTEHRGRVVTKEELFRAVWPDTVVSESALTFTIRELRRVLGENSRTPRYVETVHRRGYRFIAPLTSMPPMQDSAPTVQGSPTRNQQVDTSPSAVLTQGSGLRTADFPAPSTWHIPPTFVGRDAELGRLHGWLEKASGGERQIIFVAGEAGIGKTAVVETFLQHVALNGVDWVGRGQCIEHYGAGEAYLPVLEALGRVCRGPNGAEFLTRLARYAPTWLGQMPTLLALLGREPAHPATQGTSREKMLRELMEALEAITTERPLILILEDLHWSDTASVELLAALARRREAARLFVIGTYRPVELILREHPLKRVKQELQLHGRCIELPLDYLTEAEVREYLTQRFAGQAIAGTLSAFVHQRTGGNPLFMVILADYMEHRGGLGESRTPGSALEDLAGVAKGVPEGLRQLIEAQLVQLRLEERQVLEVGSVVGAEFAVAAVAAGVSFEGSMVEGICEELVRRGHFIEDRGLAAWPDGTVSGRYGFRHALYQEVLYERMSVGRRAQLHLAVGAREEAGYGEGAAEGAAELALHFERGHVPQKAAQYHHHAAQQAIRRHAHSEAQAHITSGLTLLQLIPDGPARAQLELWLQTDRGVSLTNTLGFGVPEVENAYVRAYEICQDAADIPALFPVLFGLWTFWAVCADLRRAAKTAHRLGALARRQSEPALLVEAHASEGQTCGLLGELAAAQSHFERGLALYDVGRHGHYLVQYGEDPGVVCHNVSAQICWLLGFPDQARRHLDDGRRLARELAYPFGLAQNLWRGAVVLQCCGGVSQVAERAHALIGMCREGSIPVWLAGGLILRGWACAQQGRGEEGVALIRQGLEDWRASGNEWLRPYYIALLADAYGKAGQVEDARTALAEALAIVERTGERWYEAELYRLKGELLLKKSGARIQKSESSLQSPTLHTQYFTLNAQAEAEAEACFYKAIEVVRTQQAKSLELRATVSLARLWQQQGKKKQAHKILAEIYNWFTEGFDTADLQEARALLEELT